MHHNSPGLGLNAAAISQDCALRHESLCEAHTDGRIPTGGFLDGQRRPFGNGWKWQNLAESLWFSRAIANQAASALHQDSFGLYDSDRQVGEALLVIFVGFEAVSRMLATGEKRQICTKIVVPPQKHVDFDHLEIEQMGY